MTNCKIADFTSLAIFLRAVFQISFIPVALTTVFIFSAIENLQNKNITTIRKAKIIIYYAKTTALGKKLFLAFTS
jgi:hypothetical protein